MQLGRIGVGRMSGSRVARLMEGERHIIPVEDHYTEGGTGKTVKSAPAAYAVPVHC
jgi:6-phosphogluconate dehydrogenase (decarboxylating)